MRFPPLLTAAAPLVAVRWLAALSLALALAPPARAATPINGIVAIINNDVITALEVEEAAGRAVAAGAEARLPAARRRALNDLIDRKVMLHRALEVGVRISDNLLAGRLNELREAAGAESEEEWRKQAGANYGMSYMRFRENVREEMAIQALFYREIYLNTRVFDAELDQFLLRETELGARRQYRFAHALVAVAESDLRADRRALAEELRARVAGGEDLVLAAADYADLRVAASDLGWKREDELPSAFVGPAHSLATGEVAPIVETSRGFHVLLLLSGRGGEARDKVSRTRLAHVFFPLNEREKADEALAELRAGAGFAAVARRHSTDRVSADNEGDLGWFGEGELPPYFAPVVAALDEDEISDPVESPFGWHILRVLKKETEAVDIAQLRDRARRFLRERRAAARQGEWLRRLRGAAYVRVVDPAYSAADN